MGPLISVIVTIFNRKQYLSKCIDSILNQTYSNLEIIIIDDGSYDGAAEICDAYSDSYYNIIVKHIDNVGLVLARKLGAELASGEYLMFVDADDYLDDDLLEGLVKGININVEAEIITGCYCIDDNNKIKHVFEVDEPKNLTREVAIKELFSNRIYDWTLVAKLYKKILFSKVENLYYYTNNYGEDTAVNWRLFSNCTCVVYVPANGYHYVMHEDSMMHSSDLRKQLVYADLYIHILSENNNDEIEQIVSILMLNTIRPILLKIIQEIYELKIDYEVYRKKINPWLLKYIGELNQDNIYRWKIIDIDFKVAREKWLKLVDDCIKIYEDLSKQARENNSSLYIYGSGEVAKNVTTILDKNGCKFDGCIVSQNKTNAFSFMGLDVKELSDLRDERLYVLIALNNANTDEVRQNLELNNAIFKRPEICNLW